MIEEGLDCRAQAAFGAPIGGVLFSMEEACTHWSRKVAVRCFVCTTVAVCTVGLLNPKCAPEGAAGCCVGCRERARGSKANQASVVAEGLRMRQLLCA